MDSMMRHFGLKKAVSGFLLVFDSHPCWHMEHDLFCMYGRT